MSNRIRRGLITVLLATAFVVIPSIALADNCGSFSDCYDTARAAAAAATALTIAGIILSTALDLSPVGPIKAGIQAYTGRDLITNEKVNRWEQAAGVIPLGSILKVGSKAALHFAKDTARVARIMEKTGEAVGGARRTAAQVMQQSDNWRTAGRVARSGAKAADVKEKFDNAKSIFEAGQKIDKVVNEGPASILKDENDDSPPDGPQTGSGGVTHSR